jgi:glucosyl-3-phosphoglycerate synthase
MPARNEEATVGAIVASIVEELVERHHVVDEVVVVDDGSTDATAAVAADAGAVVVSASSVLPECGPGTGKGEALWKSLYVATGDVLVFCDADLTDFDPAFVTGLLGPLLLDPTGRPDVGFVKGHYDRPVGGGRVTELMARPALGLFFPELLRIRQPLGGEFAARRAVLEQVPFVQGYGVDLGLLVDVAARFGPESIAQIDLGTRTHRNRGLDELGQQATAVLRVALRRAGVPDRPGWGEADVAERPPIVEVEAYRARRSATTAATQSTVAL